MNITNLLGDSLTDIVDVKFSAQEEELNKTIFIWKNSIAKSVQKEEREVIKKLLDKGGKLSNLDMIGIKRTLQDKLWWMWFNVFEKGSNEIAFFSNQKDDIAEFTSDEQKKQLWIALSAQITNLQEEIKLLQNDRNLYVMMKLKENPGLKKVNVDKFNDKIKKLENEIKSLEKTREDFKILPKVVKLDRAEPVVKKTRKPKTVLPKKSLSSKSSKEKELDILEKGISTNEKILSDARKKEQKFINDFDENGKIYIPVDEYEEKIIVPMRKQRDKLQKEIKINSTKPDKEKDVSSKSDSEKGIPSRPVNKSNIPSRPVNKNDISSSKSSKPIDKSRVAKDQLPFVERLDKRSKEEQRRNKDELNLSFMETSDFGRVYVKKRLEYISDVYTGRTKKNMESVFQTINREYQNGEPVPNAIQKYFEYYKMTKSKDGNDMIRGKTVVSKPDIPITETITNQTVIGERESPLARPNMSRQQSVKLYNDFYDLFKNVKPNGEGINAEMPFENRLSRIVETELSAAYNMGRLHGLYRNNVKYVRWINDYEHRISGRVCIACTARAVGTTRAGNIKIPESLTGIYTVSELLTERQLALPAHPHCFTGETLVTLKNGDKKRIDEIEIGEQIETSTTNCYDIDTSVKRISKRLYSGELITFTFENGKTITTTPEHPFWNGEYYSSATLLQEGENVCVFERLGKNTPMLLEGSLSGKRMELRENSKGSWYLSSNNKTGYFTSVNSQIEQAGYDFFGEKRKNNYTPLRTRKRDIDYTINRIPNEYWEIDILNDVYGYKHTNKFGKTNLRMVVTNSKREKKETGRFCERGNESSQRKSMVGKISSCSTRKNVEKQSYERSCLCEKSKGNNSEKYNERKDKTNRSSNWYRGSSRGSKPILQITLGSKFCKNIKPPKHNVGIRELSLSSLQQHSLYTGFLPTRTGLSYRSERLDDRRSVEKNKPVQTGISAYKVDHTRWETISSPHERFETHRKLRITKKEISKVKDIYVYNLHVNNDEVYLANDIVVHNCFCYVRPLTPDEERLLNGVNGQDITNQAIDIAAITNVGIEGLNRINFGEEGVENRSKWWMTAGAIGAGAVAIGVALYMLRSSLTSQQSAALLRRKGKEIVDDIKYKPNDIANIPLTEEQIDQSIKLIEEGERVALPELKKPLIDLDNIKNPKELEYIESNILVPLTKTETGLEMFVYDPIRSKDIQAPRVPVLRESLNLAQNDHNHLLNNITEKLNLDDTSEELKEALTTMRNKITRNKSKIDKAQTILDNYGFVDIEPSVSINNVVEQYENLSDNVKTYYQKEMKKRRRILERIYAENNNNKKLSRKKLAQISQLKNKYAAEYMENNMSLRENEILQQMEVLTNRGITIPDEYKYLEDIFQQQKEYNELLFKISKDITNNTKKYKTPYRRKLLSNINLDRFLTPKQKENIIAKSNTVEIEANKLQTDYERNIMQSAEDKRVRQIAINARESSKKSLLNYLNTSGEYVDERTRNALIALKNDEFIEEFLNMNNRQRKVVVRNLLKKLDSDISNLRYIEFAQYQKKWALFGSPKF